METEGKKQTQKRSRQLTDTLLLAACIWKIDYCGHCQLYLTKQIPDHSLLLSERIAFSREKHMYKTNPSQAQAWP